MNHTVDSLQTTLNNTKKSFLYFGEYLTQNKKIIGNNEYDIGTDLMKILLMNINSYDKIIKDSESLGAINSKHFEFIESSIESLNSINQTIEEQYGDINFL